MSGYVKELYVSSSSENEFPAHRRLKLSWWVESPKVIHHAGDDAEPAVCEVVKPPASEGAPSMVWRHRFHSSESAVDGNVAHRVWYRQKNRSSGGWRATGGRRRKVQKKTPWYPELSSRSVFQFIRRLQQLLRRFINLSASVCRTF